MPVTGDGTRGDRGLTILWGIRTTGATEHRERSRNSAQALHSINNNGPTDLSWTGLGFVLKGWMTDFHANYLAHELTRRCSSDSVVKLASGLADAQVDLRPHLVAAAPFAFQSPFSMGPILSNKVGMGKSIEVGLLHSQKWVERRRCLQGILSAKLSNLWSHEMNENFTRTHPIFPWRRHTSRVLLQGHGSRGCQFQSGGRPPGTGQGPTDATQRFRRDHAH